MSGHNKWAQIKHKKAATDAKKSKEFGKLVKLIHSEARKAGGKVDAPGLRAAIDRAKAANMPNENIERAVKKGSGEGADILEEVRYEAYGPGGAALIIEAITDNRNRTGPEMKHLLSEYGGSLATPNAAIWAFEKTAEGWSPLTPMDLSEEDLEKLAVLVEKLEEQDDVQGVYTNAA